MDQDAVTLRLLDPRGLRPHEEVALHHALFLLARLLWDGALERPILVDEKTNVILDGHHRWWVSRRLGFSRIPCYCVDYLADDAVSCLPRRDDIPVSKELVLEKALSGGVFPPKTTKHLYRELPLSAAYPLAQLR